MQLLHILKLLLGVVAHTFNSSTQRQRQADRYLSLKSVWFTQVGVGWLWLHSWICVSKTKLYLCNNFQAGETRQQLRALLLQMTWAGFPESTLASSQTSCNSMKNLHTHNKKISSYHLYWGAPQNWCLLKAQDGTFLKIVFAAQSISCAGLRWALSPMTGVLWDHEKTDRTDGSTEGSQGLSKLGWGKGQETSLHLAALGGSPAHTRFQDCLQNWGLVLFQASKFAVACCISRRQIPLIYRFLLFFVTLSPLLLVRSASHFNVLIWPLET